MPNITTRLSGLVLMLAAGAVAQTMPPISALDGTTPASLAPGAPEGAYPLSGLDSVNLGNMHLSFSVPILQIPGRGDAVTTMMIPWEQSFRVVASPAPYDCDSNGCSFHYTYVISPNGWNPLMPRYGKGTLVGRASGDTCYALQNQPDDNMWNHTLLRLTFTAPDGTEFELRDTLTGGQKKPGVNVANGHPFNRGKIFATYDGTAAVFYSDSDVFDIVGCGNGTIPVTGNLYLRNGTMYRVEQGLVTRIRDRNGNAVTMTPNENRTEISSITDGYGRTTTINTGASTDTISYPGATGSQTITITRAAFSTLLRPARGSVPAETQQTILELFGGVPYLSSPSSTWGDAMSDPISTIELPNHQLYRFYYDRYGTIARVDLPSGGSYEYDYETHIDPLRNFDCYNNACIFGVHRSVKQKRAYADRNSTTPDQVIKYGGSTVTYEDSAGSVLAREIHYNYGISDPTDGTLYSGWQSGKEYKVEYYGPQLNLLRTIENTWHQKLCQTECSWYDWPLEDPRSPAYDPRLTQVQTTLSDSGSTTAERSTVVYAYDDYNNQIDAWEHDFTGAAVRETQTAYVADPNYTGSPHLVSLVRRQTIIDGDGRRVAETTYGYDESEIQDETAPAQHEASFGAGYTTRGNPTTVARWLEGVGCLEPGNSCLVTTSRFDILGNPVKSLDPRGVCTEWGYADSPAGRNSYALPTSVKTYTGLNCGGTAMTATASYNYDIGKPASTTDVNLRTATYTYGDSLDRLTHISRPDGGSTTFTYTDVPGSLSVQTDVQTAGSPVTTVVRYDGLGRKTATLQSGACAGAGDVETDTEYDAKGRTWRVSNPYCPGDTKVWTETAYDGLDRPLTVTQPGGAVTTTEYRGPVTAVSDPAGVTQKNTTDGLGRLVTVIENPNGSTPYTTSYSYDVLDSLKGVNQSGQTRSFAYDPLKRLKQATNPESGQVDYTYDASGNLYTRTDAAGVVKTLSYDGKNRLTGFSYSGGGTTTAAVTLSYDTDMAIAGHNEENSPVGRVVKTAVAGGSETTYRYDRMGRVRASQQTTNNKSYIFGYGYDVSGMMTSMTYPSGRTLAIGYDAAGRPSSVGSYATGIKYAPHGAVSDITLGNGRYEQTCYSARLQSVGIRLGTGQTSQCANPGTDALNLVLGYGTGSSNNGNLLSQTIAGAGLPAAVTQSYTYTDGVNRLTGASEGSNWSRSFGYDAFGNMWVTSASGIAADQFTPVSPGWFNAQNNRLVNPGLGVGYDPGGKGNLTSIGGFAWSYDAENRLTSSAIGGVAATYGYDGDGRRVTKAQGSATTVYVYDAAGQLAAEYSDAPEIMPCTKCYLTADHLGSTRALTNETGVVRSRHDYLPFGEEIQSGIGGRTSLFPAGTLAINDGTAVKFTGKERDQESGLDYFGARYLSSALGRWTTPDWSAAPQPIPYANLENPQSLNLYGYVLNNPLSHIDPDGHIKCTGADAQKIGCLTIANWNSEHGISQAHSVSSDRRTTVIHADGSMEMRHGNIAFRDNNPGNLRPGPFSEAHGQIGVDVTKKSGSFAVFEDSLDGEAALRALLATPRVQKRSILDEMKKFAPADDHNDPVGYAKALAGALKVDVNTPMSSLSPAQLDIFVEKVKQKEGFYDPTGRTVRLSGTVRITQ